MRQGETKEDDEHDDGTEEHPSQGRIVNGACNESAASILGEKVKCDGGPNLTNDQEWYGEQEETSSSDLVHDGHADEHEKGVSTGDDETGSERVLEVELTENFASIVE